MKMGMRSSRADTSAGSGSSSSLKRSAKHGLEQIEARSALSDAIFNSAYFWQMATDERGVIQIFNVGAEAMLGYDAVDVVDRITPADISDPQELIKRAAELSAELDTPIAPGFEALVFKAKRGIEDIYELTYVRKDGNRFPAIVSVTALRDAAEDIIGYLLIGTDTSARTEVTAKGTAGHHTDDASGPDSAMAAAGTILIVDERVQNRRLLQTLLEPEGYVTRTAASGEEALTSIAADQPDLILMDVMIPGMNGQEVARTIKADRSTRNIPIIMVTAQTDREARLAAMDGGAEDFLTKPIDRTELWLRVRNLLRLKRLSDLLEQDQVTVDADAEARTADLQRFRAAMDTTNDSIVLVSRTTMQFVEVNATAAQMLGYSREELLELGPRVSMSRDQLKAEYDQIIASQGRTASIETAHRKDGSTFPIEVHRQAQRSGADWIIVVVTRDITERIEAESRLQRQAHFDALTGLLNRTRFRETLTKTLAHASTIGQTVAVLFLDLDYFKNVNDTYGHGVGDELLIQVSDRLVQCVRVRDCIGRLGGDEFALILTMPKGRHDAAVVASKIQTALLEPFCLNGRNVPVTVTVTASIGITLSPDDATDADTLLRYADTAMYTAKQAGRDNYQFFTSAMDTEVSHRLELETALRQAVKNGEFVLHYQPQVELAGGHVIGLEALLRWERPGHGLVQPGEFIAALEESDLIVDVGRWVIAAACEQIREWIRRGIDPVRVAVNVSPRQLVKGDLEGDVLRALDVFGVPGGLLEVEVTETLLMTSTDRTGATLQTLKAAGVHVSIDDFGTGYSSLAYLRRFPIDKLKIDRSFICDVTKNADDAAIVMAIIRMGHCLNLEVIAEGVETASQLAFLRGNDCDQMQGYYFSTPLPVPALEALLLAGTSLPAADGQTLARRSTSAVR